MWSTTPFREPPSVTIRASVTRSVKLGVKIKGVRKTIWLNAKTDLCPGGLYIFEIPSWKL